MPFTVQELVWLHRLMNSDDPFEREFAWHYWRFFSKKREAQRKT